MYNKFIDRLLDNDPKKVLSKGSIRARKIISPVLRFAIPFVTPNSKLKVLRRAKLLPGIYDVAKESGALVVPIATYRNGKKAYGIMEETFDICAYDRETGLRVLRDKLAIM